MEHCGLLHFHFDDKPQPWEVHGERQRSAALHAAAAAAAACACRAGLFYSCSAPACIWARSGFLPCPRATVLRASNISRPRRQVPTPGTACHAVCNHCAVFRVSAFEGQPVRTDEMEPLWFEPGQVPFEKMWADDIHW